MVFACYKAHLSARVKSPWDTSNDQYSVGYVGSSDMLGNGTETSGHAQ